MSKLSLSGQITAVSTAKRALANPASNVMRGTERKLLIDNLDAVIASLEFCQKHLPEIRELVAAKKAQREGQSQ